MHALAQFSLAQRVCKTGLAADDGGLVIVAGKQVLGVIERQVRKEYGLFDSIVDAYRLRRMLGDYLLLVKKRLPKQQEMANGK